MYARESAANIARSQAETVLKYSPMINTLVNAVEGIKYGSVEITIHDSTVVQIERRERFRLQKDPRPA
ncbi:MAG: YezD family protein [Candidatus Hydrogenedentes bacterium]|nr:YezD family protein [Candidatus Hydrogenedentota bacterium]